VFSTHSSEGEVHRIGEDIPGLAVLIDHHEGILGFDQLGVHLLESCHRSLLARV
jgi:hypothetical protein